MKAIVHIKTSGKKKCSLRRLFRHCYLKAGRTPREVEPILKDGNRVVGKINGMVGAMTGKPAEDAKALAGDIKGRSQYRHVILSLEEGADRLQGRSALLAMSREWVKTFAPRTPYLAVIHDDRAHLHAHLILANQNSEGMSLGWKKSSIREMQSMDWVSPPLREQFNIQSGRNRGRNVAEYSKLRVYPLSRGLLANKLAEIGKEGIYGLIKSGEITVARTDAKTGEPKSIVYEGRKIRLSTIIGLGGCGQRDVRCESGDSDAGVVGQSRCLYRRRSRSRPSIG